MAGTRTKTRTVLFTDLVASTALLSRLAPSAAELVRRRHFAELRAALSVHGGHEVKSLGDGLMAAFESARDALDCAVAMQRAVAQENRLRPETPLAMRVGLAAGEVSVDGGDYFGVAVVAASRLCATAGPGEILADAVVHVLAGTAVEHQLAPVGPVTLKGLLEPVDVWRVECQGSERFALRVAVADDSVLLRRGMCQVLAGEGVEVVLEAGDAGALLEAVAGACPHVAIIDVRMPPTFTTEGIDAAIRIREQHPHIAVLVLSADLHVDAARRLLAGDGARVGYMLKDRIADIEEVMHAIRALAAGGSVLDPAIARQLESAAA